MKHYHRQQWLSIVLFLAVIALRLSTRRLGIVAHLHLYRICFVFRWWRNLRSLMDDNNVCQMKVNVFVWHIIGRAVACCGPELCPAVTGAFRPPWCCMTGHMAEPVMQWHNPLRHALLSTRNPSEGSIYVMDEKVTLWMKLPNLWKRKNR